MKFTYKEARNRKSNGFTLVELLVVIAIIAALAALATPMIMKAMVKAKIVSAVNVCTALESAVDRFESDYNYLPYDSDSPSDDEELATSGGDGSSASFPIMEVLTGAEQNVNFKKIAYFSLSEPKGAPGKYKDGMLFNKKNKIAALYDPWGQPYYMVFDYGLDDEIIKPFKRSSESETASGRKVLIYSPGPKFSEEGNPTGDLSTKRLRLIPSNFTK